jgi:hypothetical protein
MATPPFSPPPSAAVTRAAVQYGLGRLRQTVALRKNLFLGIRTQVTGYIYEFDDGIVHERQDNTVEVYRWDQISTVLQSSTRHYTNSRYRNTSYHVVLNRAAGGSLALAGAFLDPSITRRGNSRSRETHLLYRILDAACQRVSQLQLPVALAALGRGERLAFGDITISLTGVHTAKGFVPWTSISEVQVQNGYVRIKQAKKFFALSGQSVGRIPNFPLFFTLAEKLRLSSRTDPPRTIRQNP